MKHWPTWRCEECLNVHCILGKMASDIGAHPILGELLYSRKNQNGRQFRRQNQSGKQPGRQNQCGRPELSRTENYILGTIADLRDFDERFRVL